MRGDGQRESPRKGSVPGLSCLRYAYRIDPATGGQSGPGARLSVGEPVSCPTGTESDSPLRVCIQLLTEIGFQNDHRIPLIAGAMASIPTGSIVIDGEEV
jgi:hypothetical protein